MRSEVSVCIAIVAAGLCYGAPSRQASAAVADFQYGTQITPSPINPTTSVPSQGSLLNQAGVGSFPVPTASTYNAALNGPAGTDVTAGTITITDLGIGSYVDTYGPTPISLKVAIRDVTSGSIGTFTFAGSLGGLVSNNGTGSAAAINNPFAAASQTQTIGSTVYDVSLIPTKDFAAPGAPPFSGSGVAGVYSINVSTVIPEPASAMLIATGVTLLVSARRRTTNRR